MSNSLIKVFTLFIAVLLTLLTLSSCDLANDEEVVDSDSIEELTEKEMENEEEFKDEELKDVKLSENDFAPSIGTLPYKGAVLFINYDGDEALSDYELSLDIIDNGEVKQQNMRVEEIDGDLVGIIVDLMYLPESELDFVIKIQDSAGEEWKHHHSETLERYPWKDWMLDLEEPVILYAEQVGGNFNYNNPNHFLGAHSSWDYWTRPGEEVEVYCGTIGVVHRIVDEHDNIEIYNPYVGAIVQYGHTFPTEDLYVGKDVNPGDLISYTVPEDRHIHYSVIRPYYYTSNPSHALTSINLSTKWDNYYWPIIWTQDKFIYHDDYNDPFYWHEPATLGYWYEESLPEGLKEEMISIFKRDNPNITLPATEPIEPLDEPDEQVEPDPEPELEEATAEIVARYFGYPRLSVLIKQKQLHSAYVASTELLEEDIQIPQEVFIKEWNLARIIIPKIDVDLIVLGGVEVFDPENLDKGPVHFGESLENGARYQGSLPNTESGNVAIAGHSGGKWLYFLDLEFLEEGDEIYLDIQGYRFVYHVQRQEVTDQYDWSYLEPTDYPALTLMTGVSKKEYIEPDNYRLFLSAKLHEVTRTPVLD